MINKEEKVFQKTAKHCKKKKWLSNYKDFSLSIKNQVVLLTEKP
jgi:hypothetical protein